MIVALGLLVLILIENIDRGYLLELPRLDVLKINVLSKSMLLDNKMKTFSSLHVIILYKEKRCVSVICSVCCNTINLLNF